MRQTTASLLDSLQSIEDADETRRQHLFEVVTQLPKEMRRWLLSLHHDTEAVNEAMGLVEFTHLKILRRQSLELKVIEPIVVEGEHVFSGDSQSQAALKNWHEGQWFSVNTETDGTVRMQLVLRVESSQQLVFTNLAGLKVLQLSFVEFVRLMEQKKVIPLYSGASFSLCLAHAVGIDSVEIMNALVSALADNDTTATPAEPPSSPAAAASAAPQATPVTPEPELEPEPEPEPEPEAEPEPATEPELEHEPGQEFVPHYEPAPAEDLLQIDDELIFHEFDNDPQPLVPAYEARELGIPGRPAPPVAATPAETPSREIHSGDRPARTKSAGTLFDQAQQIKAKGGYFIQPAEPVETFSFAPAEHPRERNTLFGRAQGGTPRGNQPIESYLTEAAMPAATPADEPAVTGSPDERHINLPMGAWLGFHDGEMPLMAKLAVHDTEDDYFIFVNRKGVKMRKISRLELLALIDQGMVDILQTNSNFRNAVSEVRNKLDH